MKKTFVGASVVMACALAVTGCASNNGSQSSGSSSSGGQQLQGTLTGGGASTQESAMKAWTSGFQQSQPAVQVQYSPTGSGAGVTAFLAGQQQFANSDKSLTTDEWTKSKSVCGDTGAVNIPVYISPIAVAYNVKGVDKSLNMDADTIAKIFAGQIKTWNDTAIAQQNPGVTLPATKITPVHRSDKSGTTYNFTDYLSQTASSVWTAKAAEDWPANFAGESGKGTSGVVQVVNGTDGAITYADASAVGQLKAVSPKVGNSNVAMSADAAAKVLDLSKKTGGESDKDMAYTIDRKTTESGVYPIVLVSYQIYCNTYKDKDAGAKAKAFATYVVSADGQKAAAQAAGSAPLSTKLQSDAKAAVDNIKAGA